MEQWRVLTGWPIVPDFRDVCPTISTSAVHTHGRVLFFERDPTFANPRQTWASPPMPTLPIVVSNIRLRLAVPVKPRNTKLTILKYEPKTVSSGPAFLRMQNRREGEVVRASHCSYDNAIKTISMFVNCQHVFPRFSLADFDGMHSTAVRCFGGLYHYCVVRSWDSGSACLRTLFT
jgi:hypothetical protein